MVRARGGVATDARACARRRDARRDRRRGVVRAGGGKRRRGATTTTRLRCAARARARERATRGRQNRADGLGACSRRSRRTPGARARCPRAPSPTCPPRGARTRVPRARSPARATPRAPVPAPVVPAPPRVAVVVASRARVPRPRAGAPPPPRAGARGRVRARVLIRAFDDAMAAGSDFDAADARARDRPRPDQRRGVVQSRTKRLQAGRWGVARVDLERSVELSPDRYHPDALSLNYLGNAQGALGEWDAAAASYLEASKDRELESIALANLALARFQTEDVDAALRTTATLLRDPSSGTRAPPPRSCGRTGARPTRRRSGRGVPPGRGSARPPPPRRQGRRASRVARDSRAAARGRPRSSRG